MNKTYARDIGCDPVYKSKVIQRMINMMTKDGKKQVAEKIMYGAIEIFSKSEEMKGLKPDEIVDGAVAKVRPSVEAVSKRIKGSTLPVPSEVSPRRAEMLALRWILKGAVSKRTKQPLKFYLANEIIDAYHERGYAIKKRDEVHATAKANRAFAHFGRQ